MLIVDNDILFHIVAKCVNKRINSRFLDMQLLFNSFSKTAIFSVILTIYEHAKPTEPFYNCLVATGVKSVCKTEWLFYTTDGIATPYDNYHDYIDL